MDIRTDKRWGQVTTVTSLCLLPPVLSAVTSPLQCCLLSPPPSGAVTSSLQCCHLPPPMQSAVTALCLLTGHFPQPGFSPSETSGDSLDVTYSQTRALSCWRQLRPTLVLHKHSRTFGRRSSRHGYCRPTGPAQRLLDPGVLDFPSRKR